MVNIPNSPLFTLLALGLSTLLIGGVVGGEFARQRYVKEEIKDIEKQHKEILTRMEAAYLQALEHEKEAITRVDSIYTILGLLDIKEGKIRGNIKEVQAAANRQRALTNQTKQDLADQGKKSPFDFEQ